MLMQAMSSPATMGWQQRRVLALLGVVMVLSIAGTIVTAQQHILMGRNVLLLWVFDGAANTVICLKSFAAFGIHQLDLVRDSGADASIPARSDPSLPLVSGTD